MMTALGERCWKAVLVAAATTLLGGNGAVADLGELSVELGNSLAILEGHVVKATAVTQGEFDDLVGAISSIGDTGANIQAAFDVVTAYESRNGGISKISNRAATTEYAVATVMQGILDHAYGNGNLAKYHDSVFASVNASFPLTSKYFPGKVTAEVNTNEVHRAKINCVSMQPSDQYPVMYDQWMSKRPTGTYLPPGVVATVTLPQELVNQGYEVRVGSHTWPLTEKKDFSRLDRITVSFGITSTTTRIHSPVGGGIYIDVPVGQNKGVIEVTIQNAIRMPFFSWKSFHRTTLEEWNNVESKWGAPWADFESDKFMMNVPAPWVKEVKPDPVQVMKEYDMSMDVISTLSGQPLIRRTGKTILYVGVDTKYRGSANFPGYPQSNYPYSPAKPERSRRWMVTGPRNSDPITWHELGHAMLITKFSGEREAVVNFPYVAMANRIYCVSLEEAFRKSRLGTRAMSTDIASLQWTTNSLFQSGSAMKSAWMNYQHRGYAKYVDVVKLFGWKAIDDFWKSDVEAYKQGITFNRNNDNPDSRIFRMSQAARVDLTPLMYFWGIRPRNVGKLQQDLRAAGFYPSRKIHDLLIHYRDIIPKTNEDFVKHAFEVYPGKGPRNMESGQEGFYYKLLTRWNENEWNKSVSVMDRIIDMFFGSLTDSAYGTDPATNLDKCGFEYWEACPLRSSAIENNQLGIGFQTVSERCACDQTGEEIIDGECVKSCPSGASLVAGECQCDQVDQTIVDGKCVLPPLNSCPGGASLDAGKCKCENEGEEVIDGKCHLPPRRVFIIMGQSNCVGFGTLGNLNTESAAEKSLVHAVRQGLYPYLYDQTTDQWTTSDTVESTFIMGSGATASGKIHFQGPMTAGQRNTFGPELGIGHKLGEYYQNGRVLVIKSCIGNRALGWDLLPPGTPSWNWTDANNVTWTHAAHGDSPSKWRADGQKPDGISWTAGAQYIGDTMRIDEVLSKLDSTDYEVSGFFWWQGDRDSRWGGYVSTYEQNLVSLVKQLRRRYNAPSAPFVTASLGQSTLDPSCTGNCGGGILRAMLSVADASKYPSFNVAAVDSNKYSLGGSSGGHYNGHAQTYMNIGEAMGEAMVGLLTVDPSADEPVSGDPSVDEPVSGDPSADEPVSGGPSADEPVSGDPLADEPVSGDPLAIKPVSGADVATPTMIATGAAVATALYSTWQCVC